jgi:hypothetical protein
MDGAQINNFGDLTPYLNYDSHSGVPTNKALHKILYIKKLK